MFRYEDSGLGDRVPCGAVQELEHGAVSLCILPFICEEYKEPNKSFLPRPKKGRRLVTHVP